MTTPNLNMTLPTTGASADSWGSTLNDDLTIIDSRCAKIAFKGYLNSATQSIANNTNTKVTLNGEVFDVGSYFDTTASRFTAPVNGYYFFVGRVCFDSFTFTGALASCNIVKNGTTELRGEVLSNATGTNTLRPSVSGLVYLTAAQYVELFCFQSNNASLNITNGTDASETYFTGFLAFPA